MELLYSTDCDILPILSSIEPVFFAYVGICQSRQILNNFPSDSRKTKIFTWNYIRMNPNAKFLSYVERSRSPNFNKPNLGDVQKSGISLDMHPAFSHEFLKKSDGRAAGMYFNMVRTVVLWWA